jgi:hypothetical protein
VGSRYWKHGSANTNYNMEFKRECIGIIVLTGGFTTACRGVAWNGSLLGCGWCECYSYRHYYVEHRWKDLELIIFQVDLQHKVQVRQLHGMVLTG